MSKLIKHPYLLEKQLLWKSIVPPLLHGNSRNYVKRKHHIENMLKKRRPMFVRNNLVVVLVVRGHKSNFIETRMLCVFLYSYVQPDTSLHVNIAQTWTELRGERRSQQRTNSFIFVTNIFSLALAFFLFFLFLPIFLFQILYAVSVHLQFAKLCPHQLIMQCTLVVGHILCALHISAFNLFLFLP